LRTGPALLVLAAAVAGAVGLATAAGARGADGEGSDHLGYVVDRDRLDDPEVIEQGAALFRSGCVSCHGVNGGGGRGPDIRDAGAAGAHFYLTTGRMPAASNDERAVRKEPTYSSEQIEALVAYVAALGDGPPIPQVDPGDADLARGGELYRLNCAACHQAAGAGGALSYGRNAPTLLPATPVQVAEAVRIGPGEMPVFGPDQLGDDEVDDLVGYVRFLQEGEDPGGFTLGRVGPIPEGFVAIAVGLGATSLGALWIGKRRAVGVRP
jgi:ubiquinol-cytochrome c reductase cytochrome c subunit